MRVFLRSILLLTFFFLTACAPPLTAGEMMPITDVYTSIPTNKTLERKVELGSINVVDGAGGAYARVEPSVFQTALLNALLTSNYASRSGDKASYVLDARVDEVDFPTFGFNMDAITTATYSLKNKKSGKLIFSETVKAKYEAKFGEAFDGTERARIATARAIRENITHYLRVLAKKSKSELQ